MTKHTDCVQGPTFKVIDNTLSRLEEHSERNTIALEEIARQGAMVMNHEKRLDKFDGELNQSFGQLRTLENYCRVELTIISNRVSTIERRNAREDGVEEVTGEQKKFWSLMKQRLVGPLMVGAFFLIWVFDRLDICVKIAKLFNEMRG